MVLFAEKFSTPRARRRSRHRAASIPPSPHTNAIIPAIVRPTPALAPTSTSISQTDSTSRIGLFISRYRCASTIKASNLGTSIDSVPHLVCISSASPQRRSTTTALSFSSAQSQKLFPTDHGGGHSTFRPPAAADDPRAHLPTEFDVNIGIRFSAAVARHLGACASQLHDELATAAVRDISGKGGRRSRHCVLHLANAMRPRSAPWPIKWRDKN